MGALPSLAATTPRYAVRQLLKELRKILGAHMGPGDGIGARIGHDEYGAAFPWRPLPWPWLRPERTVPTITSTLSRLMRRLTLSVALAGSIRHRP